MEFAGLTKIKTKVEDTKVQMVAPECEVSDKELVTHQDACERGWIVPTRFSCEGSWIKCVTLNDARWNVETVVVKMKH